MTTPENGLNGYKLASVYWDWVFENSHLQDCTMGMLFNYITQVSNRLNWKAEFGITSTECMAALNCTYKTYKKAFDRLVEYGFIEIAIESRNGWRPNVIRFGKITKCLPNASNTPTKREPNGSHTTTEALPTFIKPIQTVETIETLQTNKTEGEEGKPSDPPPRVEIDFKNEIGEIQTHLNSKAGKKYKFPGKGSRAYGQLSARLKEGSSVADFVTVIDNATKDEYHVSTNYNYLTLEFISRQDKFEKFLNWVPVAKGNILNGSLSGIDTAEKKEHKQGWVS